jgi:hypothetical protein
VDNKDQAEDVLRAVMCVNKVNGVFGIEYKRVL